jgi:hypothetical protein
VVVVVTFPDPVPIIVAVAGDMVALAVSLVAVRVGPIVAVMVAPVVAIVVAAVVAAVVAVVTIPVSPVPVPPVAIPTVVAAASAASIVLTFDHGC